MKLPFRALPPAYDAQAIQDTIQRALASAGLDTASGPMHDVTETIRRAMAAGGGAVAAATSPLAEVIDMPARRAPAHPARPAPGAMATRSFSGTAGARSYKVHVPTAGARKPRAVMVMLHGCTQSADDFAAGTQMNRLADEHGFIVVYPEQAAQANASRCWNWFQPQDQVRDAGEPSLIAGIVHDVVQAHGADPRRVFVAGLSAGAAMAVVLGQTYPELFAGVGAHSGLPYASAHDIPSAMAAMKGGRSGLPVTRAAAAKPRRSRAKPVQAVPLIMFHGDRDHTVQHSNGEQIVQHAQQARQALADGAALQVVTETGVATGGRRFSRTVHADGSGQAWIESWTVHGAGHAWSGGHASGSYTDATGPDASAEMLRFFMALPTAGSA